MALQRHLWLRAVAFLLFTIIIHTFIAFNESYLPYRRSNQLSCPPPPPPTQVLLRGNNKDANLLLTGNETRLSAEQINIIMTDGVDIASLRPMKAHLIGCKIDVWAKYIFREHYYIFDGLLRTYNWTEISYDTFKNLVRQEDSSELPDAIVMCFPVADPPTLQLARQKGVKIGFYKEDMHKMSGGKPKDLSVFLNNIDYFVAAYAYHVEEYLAPLKLEHMPTMIWLPHAASPESRTLEFNNEPKRRLLMPGAAKKYAYPMRFWAIEESKKDNSNIDVLDHRGYQLKFNAGQSMDFAQVLHGYHAVFTSTSLFHYTVAKLFEIPAIGSLLVVNADVNELMVSLGFHPHVHYLPYNSTNPIPVLDYLANPENFDEIDRMRRRGYMMARANHYISHRVYSLHAYFSDQIEMYPIPKVFKRDACPSQYHMNLTECLEYTKGLNVFH